MHEEQRIKELDDELLTLGPETHVLETQTIPTHVKHCRALRQAGKHQDADALADKIEKLTDKMRSNKQRLREIEDELYPLRARLHRRKPNLRP
jgi:chromosome segregation ATPase